VPDVPKAGKTLTDAERITQIDEIEAIGPFPHVSYHVVRPKGLGV
jgi:hypothetical protein